MNILGQEVSLYQMCSLRTHPAFQKKNFLYAKKLVGPGDKVLRYVSGILYGTPTCCVAPVDLLLAAAPGWRSMQPPLRHSSPVSTTCRSCNRCDININYYYDDIVLLLCVEQLDIVQPSLCIDNPYYIHPRPSKHYPASCDLSDNPLCYYCSANLFLQLSRIDHILINCHYFLFFIFYNYTALTIGRPGLYCHNFLPLTTEL